MALNDDHVILVDLACRIEDALDCGDVDTVRLLLLELAVRFRAHSRKEEAEVFADLAEAGEALSQVQRFLEDHNRLRRLLASPGLAGQPDRLRTVLAKLLGHIEDEHNELLPYVSLDHSSQQPGANPDPIGSNT